jgi:hypothetical protein
MFAMKEYPRDVLPLYAQGHSLSRFLIDQRGKRQFMTFLADGLSDENWIRAVRATYGYPDLLTLQNSWQNWIVQGRPPQQLAGTPGTPPAALASQVVRGQSPDSLGPIARRNAASPTAPSATPSVYDRLATGTQLR